MNQFIPKIEKLEQTLNLLKKNNHSFKGQFLTEKECGILTGMYLQIIRLIEESQDLKSEIYDVMETKNQLVNKIVN